MYKIQIEQKDGLWEAEVYENDTLLFTHARNTLLHVLIAATFQLADDLDPTED